MRTYNALEGVVAVVGIDGAELTCHDASGEIVWSMGLEGGQHDAAQYRKLMQPDHLLALNGGTFVPLYQGRMKAEKHPQRFETGADPEWRPASLNQYEQQMRALIHKVGKQSKALEKRMSAMTDVDAERKRAAASEVVEPAEPPKAEPPAETEPPAKAEKPDVAAKS